MNNDIQELQAPTWAGQAHGETFNGHMWDGDKNTWVRIEHLVAPDEAVIKAEFEQSLIKAGVTDERIAEMMSYAKTFDKPIPLGDEQAFAIADKARKEIQKVRRIGADNIDAIHARYVGLWQLSNAMKKSVLPKLLAPEEVIIKHLDAYKAEQERIEREENEAREARIRDRLMTIEGFEFTRKTGVLGEEDYYVNAGGTVLKMTQITMSEDAEWGNLIKGIEVAWGEERDRKEAEERRQREEADALAARERKLAEEREDLDRRTKAINDAINTIRKNELLALGCVETTDSVHPYMNVVTGPAERLVSLWTLRADVLANYNDEEWGRVIADAKESLQEATRRNSEEAAAVEKLRLQEEAERIRTGELQELGAQPIEYPALPLHQYDAEKWVEEVRMVKVIVDKRRAEEHAQAIIKERTAALKAAGWVEQSCNYGNGPEPALVLHLDTYEDSIPIRMLVDDKHYDRLVAQGQDELARRKKVEEERIAAEAVERERQRAALQAKLDEEARIENEKRAREAEAQRIADMGDVEHLDRFYEALSKLGVEMYNTKLTSEMAKHAMKRALPYLDNAMSAINGVLEDLRK